MSILTNIITDFSNTKKNDIHEPGRKLFSCTMHTASELFWFTTSLILFLVMGPFSALAVIPALFSLCSGKNSENMKEPTSVD
jgi:hypothetical protein